MDNKAKEKAFELYFEFSKRIDLIESLNQLDIAGKKCALLCVNEIMEIISTMPKDIRVHYLNFWNEVKEEIKKL